jgi:hypothetical protein
MRVLDAKTALAAAVALTALLAGEAAYAQPPRHAAPQVYDSQENPFYRFGPRVTARPGGVVSGQALIGRDPDPSIRNELLREYDSGRSE